MDPSGGGIYVVPTLCREGSIDIVLSSKTLACAAALSEKSDPPPGAWEALAAHHDGRGPTAGRRFALILLLPFALSGCHLIDQTDFEPKRPAPRALPPVPNPDPRTALVTIDFATSNPDYNAALATAIHAAETQRPGVLYDVVSVAGNDAGALQGWTHAAEVMVAIEADGVIPARIQLGLQVDPGRKIPQVRVYLR